MIPPTLEAVMQTYPKLIEGCDVSLVDLEWRQLGLKGEHSDHFILESPALNVKRVMVSQHTQT